jgi:hypothetical protein
VIKIIVAMKGKKRLFHMLRKEWELNHHIILEDYLLIAKHLKLFFATLSAFGQAQSENIEASE